jgi:hypothetical protein
MTEFGFREAQQLVAISGKPYQYLSPLASSTSE